HGDDEAIPAAEGIVGTFLRCDTGTHFGWLRFVGAVAVDFARAGGPAPDVDLAFAVAAEVDAAVTGVGDAFALGPAVVVGRVAAVGQDDPPGHLGRLGGEPPVGDEDEVGVFLFGPQILVFGLAFAIVDEPPVFAL